MSKDAFVGVNNTSRKIKNIYIGVGGVAHKVKKGFIGVNGVARQFYADDPTTIAEEKEYFQTYGEAGYSWTTSDSGRQFARCKCDHGTIMKWNDVGTTRYTIVLDAKYRTNAALYSDYTTNLGLTKYRNYGKIVPSAPASGSDTTLNGNDNFNQDARGSTVATNQWASNSYYGTNMVATYYVRNTLSSNEDVSAGCDLPTINCLCRIYNDRAILDSMDPTVSSYSQYSLVSWSFVSNNAAWSSSWDGYAEGGYCALDVRDSGDVKADYQYYPPGVIPVLDL